MGFIWIVVIGAAAGWAAGQFMKVSEYGVRLDIMAGALGAFLSAVTVRVLSDGVGMAWSVIIAIIGASILTVGMRRFMKPIPVPAPKPRRRY